MTELATTEPSGVLQLAWLLPLLPLAGFLINLLVGRLLGAASPWLAIGTVTTSFVFTVALLIQLLGLDPAARTVLYRGPEWFAGAAYDLRLDPLSVTLALVITGVGALIHLYSVGYMHGDDRQSQYFAYLNLFVASMLVLVLSENLLVTFLGWEGVGVCSYLLIGFWWGRPGVAPAAKKAFIANRIGDAGFLVALFLLYREVGSFGITEILAAVDGLTLAVATAVALLLLLAAVGKSAQIPLYVWLPDAMAGPTPVSALIHAATMVTAGVYLIARLNPLYQAAPAAQTTVLLIGAATALLAAVIATAQHDIKRVLAYSTISQLGYMFVAVALGPLGAALAVFHLVTHACFKAQLFLGAGSVMHGNGDETDLRRFGGLRRAMPWTWATMLVSTLAIIGIPPLSGYFSKEHILAAAIGHGTAGQIAWALGFAAAVFTAFYMARMFFLTFHGRPRWPEGHQPHESPAVMVIPLVVLAALAAVAGILGLEKEGGALQTFLAPVFAGQPEAPLNLPVPELVLAALTVGVSLVAVGVAWLRYGRAYDVAAAERRAPALRRTVLAGFQVDRFYELFTVRLGGLLARTLDVLDRRVVGAAPDGLAAGVRAAGGRARLLQTGLVRSYALLLLVGVVLVAAALVLQGVLLG